LIQDLRLKAREPLPKVEGEARQAVVTSLKRMLGPGKVVLLEGPSGSGKSRAVEIAVAALPGDKKKVVQVQGHDISQPEQAFKAVLQGLGGVQPKSAAEGRQYLTFRLAELKKEGVLSVIVLHDCEVFGTAARQSLLYVLFDMTQDPDILMAVLLTTRAQDFVSSLEKRLESRLGHQRVVMPSMTVKDAEAIVRYTLTAKNEEAFRHWNESVQKLHLTPFIESMMWRNCSNVRIMINFAWLILAYDRDVEKAWNHVQRDVWMLRMESLSEIELCVLVVMKRKQNEGISMQQAYDSYLKEMRAQEMKFASKQLFERAFNNLKDVARFSDWPREVLEKVVQLDKFSTDLNTWGRGKFEKERI
jgi:energy-coupling factor transporter ATP-binding protein EcfA2